MIDKGFYEYREEDPLRRIIGVLIISLGVLVGASTVGATLTATELGCPTWLVGTYKLGGVCLAPPTNGPLWLVQYRLMPSAKIKRNVASWPPAQRQRLYRALDASWICVVVGLILSLIVGTIVGIFTMRAIRARRPKHKGTIFWANDEEVFNTGLCVNYKPPLMKRIRRWLDAK